MLRRLIALLALLSGLAAVGVPASAVALADGCEQVASAQLTQAGKVERCKARPADAPAPRRDRATRDNRTAAPVVIYVPTVMLRADRARE